MSSIYPLRAPGAVHCNIKKKIMAASYVKDAELLGFFIYNPTLGSKEGTVSVVNA